MDGVELFQTWRKNILTKSKVLLWFIFYYTKFLDCFYAHEKRVYPIFVYLSKIILPKTDKKKLFGGNYYLFKERLGLFKGKNYKKVSTKTRISG